MKTNNSIPSELVAVFAPSHKVRVLKMMASHPDFVPSWNFIKEAATIQTECEMEEKATYGDVTSGGAVTSKNLFWAFRVELDEHINQYPTARAIAAVRI
jgi:hypothetical protein